jgi:hypothetical protein
MSIMVTASQAGRALSKLGASKGGYALAAKLTREERQAQARKAVTARWARTNAGRLTNDQQRVMHRLEGLASIALPISDGPAGRRRRAAIAQLAAAGKLRIIGCWGNTVTIAAP